MKNVRTPAEWEAQSAVLLTFPAPHTDWTPMLDEVRECYYEIISALVETGTSPIVICADTADEKLLHNHVESPLLRTLIVPFNDTWIRDYGPLAVEMDGHHHLLDFGFNGWGLKFAADRDNLVNLHLELHKLFPRFALLNKRAFILEGGSVEFDGNGTMLTTSRCLCSQNRNGGLSKEEVEAQLKPQFCLEKVLWLDYGALEGDDTDSHIDTLARLCPNDTIIYCGCAITSDSHYDELTRMKLQLMEMKTVSGHGYNLMELPLPDPIYDNEGQRLPATYCNYLVTDKAVLVPTYGQTLNDRLAMKIVGLAYPEREIRGIDCRALIHQHGSLHCATMQIPLGFLSNN